MLRNGIRAAAVILVVSFSGVYGQAISDAPPILAGSNETLAPENAELTKRCLDLADKLHDQVTSRRSTHSERWGDVLRLSLTSADPEFSTRMVCMAATMNVEFGVVPSGPEELVPSTMQGVWAQNGECSVQSEQLAVTSTTVQFGARQPYEIRYFPQASKGHGLFWGIDGTFFVPRYDADHDAMVYAEKSYGRCPNASR